MAGRRGSMNGSLQRESTHVSGGSFATDWLDNYDRKAGDLSTLSMSNLTTWIREGYWVCITLKEARCLPVYNVSAQSSDTFAKIRLTPSDRDSSPIAERRTRTLHHSLWPMFEERLLCPLSGLPPNCNFELKMYDADWLRSEFCGQVKCSLAQLLEPLEQPGQANSQWFSLWGKRFRPKSSTNGEVLLEVSVMPPDQAEQVRKARRAYKQQDLLAYRFRHSVMKVFLHNITFLNSLKPVTVAQLTQGGELSIEFRIGQTMLTHKLESKITTNTHEDGTIELELDDVVNIPLEGAFERSPCVWISCEKKQNEAYLRSLDLKIIIQSGGKDLSRTQVPLWSIPTDDEPSSDNNANILGARPSSLDLKASYSQDLRDFSPSPEPSLSLDTRSNTPNAQSSPGLKLGVQGSMLLKEPGAPQAYQRTLDPVMRKSPFANSALDFSLVIAKKHQHVDTSLARASPESSEVYQNNTKTLDMLEEQEDERDAPPLQEVPEPFPIKCLEMTFGFGPCKLYRTLLKAGSSMIDNIAKVEGLENFTRSPWEMVEGEGGRPLRQRKITYRKPMSIPFAPKWADCEEVQTIKVKEVAGWVGEAVMSTSAPMGDTFRVVTQLVGVRGTSADTSTLRVTLKVAFLKSPGMLKSVILSNTQKEAIAHWAMIGKAIREFIEEDSSLQDNEGDTPTSSAAPSTPAANALPQVASTQPLGAFDAQASQELSTWQKALLLLGLGFLLAAVLASWQVSSAIKLLARAIEKHGSVKISL